MPGLAIGQRGKHIAIDLIGSGGYVLALGHLAMKLIVGIPLASKFEAKTKERRTCYIQSVACQDDQINALQLAVASNPLQDSCGVTRPRMR